MLRKYRNVTSTFDQNENALVRFVASEHCRDLTVHNPLEHVGGKFTKLKSWRKKISPARACARARVVREREAAHDGLLRQGAPASTASLLVVVGHHRTTRT
jgi:hypothetical protein